MGLTCYSIMSNGFPRTNGASVDYGFDINIYTIRGKKPPDFAQMSCLAQIYSHIISSGGRDLLHEHLMSGTLKQFIQDTADSQKKALDMSWVECATR